MRVPQVPIGEYTEGSGSASEVINSLFELILGNEGDRGTNRTCVVMGKLTSLLGQAAIGRKIVDGIILMKDIPQTGVK